MPDILADPPSSLYIVLILVAVIPLGLTLFFGGVAQPRKGEKLTSPRKWSLITSGVGLVLLLALFLCDRVFESDREQIHRKMKEMSDGVRERNMDKVFQHVSDSFRIGLVDKPALRRLAEADQQNHQVDEIPVWDERLEPITDGKNAVMTFMFKVRGNQGEMPFRGKAYFVRDPDGQWRIQRFEVFNFTGDGNTPIQIPGL